MKTYSVLFAEDVPHYATEEIEAPDDTAAIEAATNFDRSKLYYDPEWENAVCKRIVHIEDEDGHIIAENIPVDEFILRNGGEAERRLCDAAPTLLEALRKIAAIPLWGEPIADDGLRRDYIDTAQYDEDENEFNPSTDTESELLRDAVEEARAVLAAFEPGVSCDATPTEDAP